MTFTRESGLVKTWVSMVQSGAYKREQVPELFNLREVVYEVLDEMAENAA